MPRKRHATSEALLQEVIAGLEDDYRPKYRGAVLALLSQGPFLCGDALLKEIQQPATEACDEGFLYMDSLVRAELLAFLRNLVRREGFTERIGLCRAVNFSAHLVGGHVEIAPDGDMRDLAVLQFVLLLDRVGLRNIRKCAAEDCDHLYVKTYRRRFHSVRCQKRILARKRRQEEHEEQEQKARAKRRRITKGQG